MKFEKGLSIQFDSKAFNNEIKNMTKQYAAMPARLQKKALRRAFGQFVRQNKLKQVFKSHVPKGDGYGQRSGYKAGGMQKSVGYKTYFYRRTREWIAKVGLMRRKGSKGYVGIFVDEGTQERFVGAGKNTTNTAKAAYKKGLLRSVGAVAAKPFAKKAERATLAAGKSSFLRHMKEALEWVEQKIPKKPSKRRG